MKKKPNPQQPEPRDATGRVMLLKAIPYKGCMVYIRRIGVDFFEYLVVFDKEIYTGYWIISPPKGKKDLTKEQISQAGGLAMAGAMATIDMQYGVRIDKATKETVDTFEKNRPKC